MLTRSANASPSIRGFHYAPSHSPRHSPSRNSAATAPAAATARRPSSSSSPLVIAAAALTTASLPSSPALSHSRLPTPLTAPPAGTQPLRSPPRYVAVDAATQYSPMEPFDYAAQPRRQHPPPPPLRPSSSSPSLSKQSTPREVPPTPGPVPMEPGIEQGVDRSDGGDATNGHGRQVDSAQEQLSQTLQQQPKFHPSQTRPAPGALVAAPHASASASASTSSSFSNNHPPSASTVPPTSTTSSSAESQQQQQPPYTSSPQKRRSSQGPAAQEGDNGEGSSVTGADPLPSPSVVHSPLSSAKRPKPEVAPPKVLPARYELCPVEDMVVLIANMLGELIETNDALALKSGHLTRFHSRTAPGISVLDYLHRLAKHATLTPPLLLSMVYYIDRLCAMYPDFTINTLTVHRFLITAATVAAKGLSDSFWNNSTYARVGGVRVAELKMLELEFLYRLEWKIVPNPEVLAAYYRPLVERCLGYALPSDSSPSRDEDDLADDGIDDDATARNSQGGRTGAPSNSHNRQSSTSLIGEDMVVSGLTGQGSR